MAPISLSPISTEDTAQQPSPAEGNSPSESTGFSPDVQVVQQAEAHTAPTLTPLDGGYAGLPQRPAEAPVALEQMGPTLQNKTNVPMMLQGGVFVLLPLFFANNPAMFQQNRMFIWILFALGCGLIASQVPGVDNLNLPKIKLFGLEFAARGWVAVSIIVVMALVNPTKPILDTVSSAINNNKPVVSTAVTVSPDSKTGTLRETAPEALPDTQPVSTPSDAPPLTLASVPPNPEPIESRAESSKPMALTPMVNSFATMANDISVKSASAVTAKASTKDAPIGVSAANDVTTLEKLSYKDRIILPTVQWQAMGITLKTGDILSINNVRGSWTLSDAAHENAPMVEADGGTQALISPKGKMTLGDLIMPSALPAALIGRIGVLGQPFIVGKHLVSLLVNTPGELYLSINDGSTLGTPGFWDNAGQMQANINVLTAANLE